VGFRIIKGAGKSDADYGKLFVCQVADKEHDADLITVFVQQLDLVEQLLKEYGKGDLRWIDTYCTQFQNGREVGWMLERIYSFGLPAIQVGDAV
jgi:hypothetical protein